jgi:hypothetical protein
MEENIIKTIKQFSRDDFQTRAPYDYLYSLTVDRFTFGLARNMMADQAKNVGFKGFATMCRDYEGSIETTYCSAENTTSFTDQPLNLVCGKWISNDNGIYYLDRNGESVCACAHPIMPIARLIDFETKVNKVKLAYRQPGANATWQELIVDMDTIAISRNITVLATWGISVTSTTAKALVDYLHDLLMSNCDIIPVERSVSKLGYFRGYGFVPYVDSLVFGGGPEYRPLFDAVAEHGSQIEWYKMALEARKESIPARIMLAASFASALLSVVGSLPFFVHLWSVCAGTGKTVALMIAASVWGNPAPGHYLQSHNATQVGTERMAAFLDNLPYCLDELQLAKDRYGKSTVDVYQLAEGIGRTRSNKRGTVEQTPTWHNCFLSTGETPIAQINSGAGAINRVVDIECNAKTIVLHNGPKFADTVRDNYGFAGRMFVDKLYASDTVQHQVREMYNESRQQLISIGVTDKQAMAGAAIITADQLSTHWIFKDEMELSCEDIAPYLAKNENASLGAAAYDFLCDWIVSNLNRFQSDTGTPIHDILGVIENQKAYIIRTKFADALASAGYHERAVLSYLRAHKLIDDRGDKGYCRPKHIGGIRRDCIVLYLPNDKV